MYAKLDQNFKCPKEFKVMLAGQSPSQRRGMYDALQSYTAFKKKSLKTKTADRAE
jgi:hypothetical protein